MEKAKRFLELSKEEDAGVSGLVITPHKILEEYPFYADFAIRGIRLDRFKPGFLTCSFTVPPRLTNREGNLASGAIANLFDVVSTGLLYKKGARLLFSTVSLSISYFSTAKLQDELELTAEFMGQNGPMVDITVVRNKASGHVVAQGRVTMFNKLESRL